MHPTLQEPEFLEVGHTARPECAAATWCVSSHPTRQNSVHRVVAVDSRHRSPVVHRRNPDSGDNSTGRPGCSAGWGHHWSRHRGAARARRRLCMAGGEVCGAPLRACRPGVRSNVRRLLMRLPFSCRARAFDYLLPGVPLRLVRFDAGARVLKLLMAGMRWRVRRAMRPVAHSVAVPPFRERADPARPNPKSKSQIPKRITFLRPTCSFVACPEAVSHTLPLPLQASQRRWRAGSLPADACRHATPLPRQRRAERAASIESFGLCFSARQRVWSFWVALSQTRCRILTLLPFSNIPNNV